MCDHYQYKTVSEFGFLSALSSESPNPAAHGSITETQVCLACGARRFANVNGPYMELGHYGPSRDERLKMRERALALLKSCVPITHKSGARVYVDSNAMVVVEGSLDNQALSKVPWLPLVKEAYQLLQDSK